MPSVFPFIVSEKYLIFGLQKDYQESKETKTRLIVIDRGTQELYLEPGINKEKVDAGLRKITLRENSLFYIDSYNTLHEIQLNQKA